MRLLEVAKRMSELPRPEGLDVSTSVHIRDLQTIIKRLLEHIETVEGTLQSVAMHDRAGGSAEERLASAVGIARQALDN